MCGIAGVIHRDGSADIGAELTAMLQSMKHRGPDSTGYAVYGPADDLVVIRFVLAEPNKSAGFGMAERLERNRAEVESRLAKIGAEVAAVTRRDRVRVPGHHPLRRRSQGPGRLPRGRARLRGAVAGQLAGDHQGSRRCRNGERPVQPGVVPWHPRASVMCAWPPNPKWTWPVPTLTGPTRSRTWPWCTTASSPTTTSGAGVSNSMATGSRASATPRSSPSTWLSTCRGACRWKRR